MRPKLFLRGEDQCPVPTYLLRVYLDEAISNIKVNHETEVGAIPRAFRANPMDLPRRS